MLKLLSLGLLLLSSVGVLAQRPPALDVYTNPDGAFQFSYPENYELLFGERILKATQGRGAGIPVCDFSTALVCVIYPIEKLGHDKVEAAGFSVDAVPGLTAESDCLAYADQLSRPSGEHSQPLSLTLNRSAFRNVSVKRTAAGHSQSSDLYITFQKDRCYELRIAISLSDESSGLQRSSSKSIESADAENARGALKLVLSTFGFR